MVREWRSRKFARDAGSRSRRCRSAPSWAEATRGSLAGLLSAATAAPQTILWPIETRVAAIVGDASGIDGHHIHLLVSPCRNRPALPGSGQHPMHRCDQKAANNLVAFADSESPLARPSLLVLQETAGTRSHGRECLIRRNLGQHAIVIPVVFRLGRLFNLHQVHVADV